MICVGVGIGFLDIYEFLWRIILEMGEVLSVFVIE